MLSIQPLPVRKLDFAKVVFPLLVFCAAATIASPAQTLTTLHSFNYSDGAYPFDVPIQGSDGNLYATTEGGGSTNCNNINQDGCGTIFKITLAGAFTSVYPFCTHTPCPVGYQPWDPLVQASDGNFYGTTNQGGRGWIFKMTPTFGVSALYNFTGNDGAYPYSGLVQGSDGLLYGTTSGDEVRTSGTVFKINPVSQVLTTLHAFSGPDGDTPNVAVVEGADGRYYGTTYYGGSNNTCDFGCGTVFKVTSGGTLTTLHNFAGSDGFGPNSPLVLGTDGNLYGTTAGGGAHGFGTFFKITTGGTLTTLHSFSSTDGTTPEGAIVQASDGNFYGVTYGGGSGGVGTIFKVTSGGTLTSLHSFRSDGADGAHPAGGLMQASNGNFYGTTAAGGAHAPDGTVFMLTGPQAIPTTTALTSAPNPSNQGQAVTMTATVRGRNGSIPAGNVVFESDGVGIGTVALNGSGVAVLHYSNLTMGTHYLVAIYQGGSGYGASISNIVEQVVQLTGSTTTVTSVPNPSMIGQHVTITATVAPSGATGTVSFTSNGTAISGCSNVPLSSGMAACMTSDLAVGTDAIVAAYSGDSNYSPSSGMLSQIVNPIPTPVQFVPITPCRIVDTRNSNGTFGGPILSGRTTRNFPLAEGDNPCGIPANALAYSLNVAVVPSGRLNDLTIWPAGQGQPYVATLNSLDGRVKSNAAIVSAGTPAGAVSVYVTDTTHVILDINGYFTSGGDSTLAFYPLAPCRVVDTRDDNLPSGLGSPHLADHEVRDLPFLTSSCLNGTVNPKAYSINIAVVPNPPGTRLNYLTVWPSDQPQPLVANLNNPTATVVANAAIVPAAANGNIKVFAYNSTDVIMDINGYFAAPGQGGLSFYSVTPCRVYDSRNNNGQPFHGTRAIPVASSQCGPPAGAGAYVFSATVVPSGVMPYLTLWPDPEQKPFVATLNAYDAAITSNMAIVPNENGVTDAYVDGLTHLIMDIAGYFAP